MPGIFLSYRRSDAGGWAGRLKDHLSLRFGANLVWQDVDDLLAGADYLPQILENIAAADAVLIVIGPHWLDDGPTGGKARLRDRRDILRLEIEHALKRPEGVIPTLVGGAQMPKRDDLPRSLAKLIGRHGIVLGDADWSRAMQLLFERLQDVVRAARAKESVSVPLLPDLLNKLDQIQTKFFQLIEDDAQAATRTAREGLQLLDEQMPNIPTTRHCSSFAGSS